MGDLSFFPDGHVKYLEISGSGPHPRPYNGHSQASLELVRLRHIGRPLRGDVEQGLLHRSIYGKALAIYHSV